MRPTEPLPLNHSWPLADAGERFDLGRICDAPLSALPQRPDPSRGYWNCDLAANRLTWSPEMYRLFGLDADRTPTRDATLAMYAEPSRAAMERLRTHAIRHRRGFTIDIAITPLGSRQRWLRLVAAPVCEGKTVVRLHGSKSDVTHLYGVSA